MSERFYSESPVNSDRVILSGQEAHHLAHVMRAKVGDRVTLFDGSGFEFDAQVEKISRSSIDLHVIERRDVNRELSFELTIGVALPKGDRQKWLVEKLTELGVTRLVPLVTERGVAQPTAAALDRLQRAVIEAAKQCGRNRLLQIETPHDWSAWMAATESSRLPGPLNVQKTARPSIRNPQSAIRNQLLVAHPGGQSMTSINLTVATPIRCAVGPEGGLTEAEIMAAKNAGWQLVDLGPRILRVETAAIVLAAIAAKTGN
jgi:16S rRNA (uracil1498-N3)-methyltransferase